MLALVILKFAFNLSHHRHCFLNCIRFLCVPHAIISTVFILAADQVCHYYIGFFMNYQPADSYMYILLTTSETYEVKYFIEIPSTDYYSTGFISASNESIVYLPRSLEATYYYDQDKGICISTNSCNVFVYGVHLSYSHFITESYLALPVMKLDNDYVYYGISVPILEITVSDPSNSSILIIGTEDNTTIKFIVPLSANLGLDNAITSLTPGREYSLVINKMQTVLIGSIDDLSGTKISADEPVSVMSGHECGNVPSNVSYCNYLIEQIPPVELWGKIYYTAPLVNKTSYTIKILAAYASTSINIYCTNKRILRTVNEGKFITEILSSQDHCAIHSSKEVLVAQFSHGGDEDDGYGSPMMTLVPPTNQYMNKFDVSTLLYLLPTFYNYTHYVNIIVMAQYYQPNMIYLTVDGVTRSLATEQWVPIEANSITEAYATQVEIPEGPAKIFHTNAAAQISVIVYGFTARYRSYGHIGGFRLPKGF